VEMKCDQGFSLATGSYALAHIPPVKCSPSSCQAGPHAAGVVVGACGWICTSKTGSPCKIANSSAACFERAHFESRVCQNLTSVPQATHLACVKHMEDPCTAARAIHYLKGTYDLFVTKRAEEGKLITREVVAEAVKKYVPEEQKPRYAAHSSFSTKVRVREEVKWQVMDSIDGQVFPPLRLAGGRKVMLTTANEATCEKEGGRHRDACKSCRQQAKAAKTTAQAPEPKTHLTKRLEEGLQRRRKSKGGGGRRRKTISEQGQKAKSQERSEKLRRNEDALVALPRCIKESIYVEEAPLEISDPSKLHVKNGTEIVFGKWDASLGEWLDDRWASTLKVKVKTKLYEVLPSFLDELKKTKFQLYPASCALEHVSMNVDIDSRPHSIFVAHPAPNPNMSREAKDADVSSRRRTSSKDPIPSANPSAYRYEEKPGRCQTQTDVTKDEMNGLSDSDCRSQCTSNPSCVAVEIRLGEGKCSLFVLKNGKQATNAIANTIPTNDKINHSCHVKLKKSQTRIEKIPVVTIAYGPKHDGCPRCLLVGVMMATGKQRPGGTLPPALQPGLGVQPYCKTFSMPRFASSTVETCTATECKQCVHSNACKSTIDFRSKSKCEGKGGDWCPTLQQDFVCAGPAIDVGRTGRQFCMELGMNGASEDMAKKSDSNYTVFLHDSNFYHTSNRTQQQACSGYASGGANRTSYSNLSAAPSYFTNITCCKAGEDPAVVERTRSFNRMLNTLSAVRSYTEVFVVSATGGQDGTSDGMCEKLREQVDPILRQSLNDIRFDMAMPNCSALSP